MFTRNGFHSKEKASKQKATQPIDWDFERGADLQDPIYTTIADNVSITIDSLYLCTPTFIADAETQVVPYQSTKKNFALSFDSQITQRKLKNFGLEFQSDTGSAHNNESPKFLLAAHQTEARAGSEKKANFNAIFDKVYVKKHFLEIDGIRYLKDFIDVEQVKEDYLNQYWDPKLF